MDIIPFCDVTFRTNHGRPLDSPSQMFIKFGAPSSTKAYGQCHGIVKEVFWIGEFIITLSCGYRRWFCSPVIIFSVIYSYNYENNTRIINIMQCKKVNTSIYDWLCLTCFVNFIWRNMQQIKNTDTTMC